MTTRKGVFQRRSVESTTVVQDITVFSIKKNQHMKYIRTLHHGTVTKFSKTWFRIVHVKLHNGNRSISCYAMLDEGSSVTLINRGLADRLNLEGPRQPLCLKWTGGTRRVEEESMLVNLYISGVDSMEKYPIYNVHTVFDLDLPTQSLRLEDLEKYNHLKEFKNCVYSDAKPMLLIGLNNSTLGVMKETREGRINEPVASRTKLGWIVHGGTNSIEDIKPNFFFHICECQKLHEEVKSYFTLESIGVVRSEKRLLSPDDAKALQIMKETTKREGNRFITGLIWKYENITLPDSYSMAYRRLQCLESKMKRDSFLAENIRGQILAYEKKDTLES